MANHWHVSRATPYAPRATHLLVLWHFRSDPRFSSFSPFRRVSTWAWTLDDQDFDSVHKWPSTNSRNLDGHPLVVVSRATREEWQSPELRVEASAGSSGNNNNQKSRT